MQFEHFKFIYCVERLVFEHKYDNWETCFEETGLDSTAVLKCYEGGDGNKVVFRHFAVTFLFSCCDLLFSALPSSS